MYLVDYMKAYVVRELFRKRKLTLDQRVEELPPESRRLNYQYATIGLDDLDSIDEQLKAVVDVMKVYEPDLWLGRNPLDCENFRWVMQLAYLLGCADGKREERAKRKT